jgi:hypothetical protein
MSEGYLVEAHDPLEAMAEVEKVLRSTTAVTHEKECKAADVRIEYARFHEYMMSGTMFCRNCRALLASWHIDPNGRR